MRAQPNHDGLPTTRLLVLILSAIGISGCRGSMEDSRDDGVEATGGHGDSSETIGGRGSGGASGIRDGSAGSAVVVVAAGGFGAQAGGSGGAISGDATTSGNTGSSISTGGKTGGSLATGGKTGSDVAAGGKTSTSGGTHPGSTVNSGGSALGGSAVGGNNTASGNSTVGGGGATQNTGAGHTEILVPESGALLGLYYGDESISATSTKLGTTVPLHLTYYAWQDDWTRGNTAEDLRSGRIPFVNWELFGAVVDDIIAGKDDAMIRQRAVAAKNLNAKLFIDFGAEMNGDWSPWSGAENGKSADKYVAAYRHVHDLFVENGASNVIWAFCPNVTSEPAENWNEPLDYYPGDTYVDWMCVDGYNWGTSDTWGIWQSFHDVFEKIYPTLASKQKPILIGEMASTELGGDKGEWISQIIPTLRTDFPLIKGLIWFDIDKETDWRISSSEGSEAAFKAMANDPYFKR